MKIGELSRRAGCKVETVRYYEREGLLPEPARSEGNFRLYDEAHVQRLTFIRHCRSLDMTLEEIRLLLGLLERPERNCDDVNALLDNHIGIVARHIEELKSLERRLRALRAQCAQDRLVRDCDILKELASPETCGSCAEPESKR